MRRIEGEQPPPPTARDTVLVRWPLPGAPLSITLLAESPTGIYVHWHAPAPGSKPRTQACSMIPGCPYCSLGTARQYRLYLAAWEHRERRRVIVPLTEQAWVGLIALVPPKEALRGTRWSMIRSGPCANSPIRWSRETTAWRLSEVPEAHSLDPALRLLHNGALPSSAPLPKVGDELGGTS